MLTVPLTNFFSFSSASFLSLSLAARSSFCNRAAFSFSCRSYSLQARGQQPLNWRRENAFQWTSRAIVQAFGHIGPTLSNSLLLTALPSAIFTKLSQACSLGLLRGAILTVVLGASPALSSSPALSQQTAFFPFPGQLDAALQASELSLAPPLPFSFALAPCVYGLPPPEKKGGCYLNLEII